MLFKGKKNKTKKKKRVLPQNMHILVNLYTNDAYCTGQNNYFKVKFARII